MKALLVDPSRVFQRLVAAALEEVGCEVVTAASGTEALEAYPQHDLELVCISYQLSDMDGMELCRKLRELARRVHTPVVMLTSREDTATLSLGLQAGITEVFRKSELARFTAYVRELKERQEETLTVTGRVLLVEDSASVRALVRGVLERAGLEVLVSAEAVGAAELFAREAFDLVLTDVLLAGGTTGLELLRRVRHSEGRKGRTPVLAMSGFEDAARRVELLRYGANDFIGKPVLPEEMVARVRNLIANKQLFDKVEMQHEYLRALAATDHLTSLYNRRFLAEVLPMTLAASRRHGYSVSVVLVDLDHFKRVNDEHGHAAGDNVLVECARLLKATCRKEDLAVRLGGEEFVLVLSHCGFEQAVHKAERVRQQFERQLLAGLPVTASFGVSTLVPEMGATFDDVFAAADQALYEAKAAGRNRVRGCGATHRDTGDQAGAAPAQGPEAGPTESPGAGRGGASVDPPDSGGGESTG